MLRLEGFSVEGASDGQEALQKAVELLPDIRPVLDDLLSVGLADALQRLQLVGRGAPKWSTPKS
jgi:CheY-like chemotaxis protein